MDFKSLVKNYYEEGLSTLTKLIQIDSVYDETTVTEDRPYGNGPFNAHKFMKELALKDGFKVDTCDNRCLEISCGEGEKFIGIFAHLDVVPATGDWKHPKFGAVIEDNKMYGRGTSDDKGPGVSAYYALKALRDANLIKGFRVKLVFGCDEERGSSCLDYYFNILKKEQPTYAFTPDGDFPLIYGEKGINNYSLSGMIDLYPVVKIEAGVASNCVIDSCLVTIKEKEKILNYLKNHKEINYEVKYDNDDVVVINFLGKSAHGSLPQLGINSGIIALKVLGEVYNNKELIKLAYQYEDPFGKNLGTYFESQNLGKTTYNVGIINYDDNYFKMVVNFRYPETVVSKDVFKVIQSNTNFQLMDYGESHCLYYDPSTPFIKKLAEIYVEETGDTINKPMTIGGGTYAKEVKNCVAFGSHFPGKEDHIHEPDEKIDLEDFYNSMSLYANAIYSLGNLK